MKAESDKIKKNIHHKIKTLNIKETNRYILYTSVPKIHFII